jgi:hypothetical protein
VQADFEPAQLMPEVSENRDAAAVSESLLEKLPVFDQDYIGRMSMFLDSASIGTKGASLVVDGIEVNNAGITASAIKEVRINQNPYSAEFFRPGRGRIEIITKDAGAAYHGTLNFTLCDSYPAYSRIVLSVSPSRTSLTADAVSDMTPLRDLTPVAIAVAAVAASVTHSRAPGESASARLGIFSAGRVPVGGHVRRCWRR